MVHNAGSSWSPLVSAVTQQGLRGEQERAFHGGRWDWKIRLEISGDSKHLFGGWHMLGTVSRLYTYKSYGVGSNAVPT